MFIEGTWALPFSVPCFLRPEEVTVVTTILLPLIITCSDPMTMTVRSTAAAEELTSPGFNVFPNCLK